jgi:hypothetical protein
MAPLLERILNQRCVKPTVGATFASPWDRPVRAKSAASPLGFTIRVFDRGTKGSKQLCGEKYVQQKLKSAERSPSPELRRSELDFDLGEVHEMLIGAKLVTTAQKARNRVLPKGVAKEWHSVNTFSENGKSKRQTWDQRLLGVNDKLQETKVNTLLWSYQTQKRLHEVVVLSSMKEAFHAWKQYTRDELFERRRKSRGSHRFSERQSRDTFRGPKPVPESKVASMDLDHSIPSQHFAVGKVRLSFGRVPTDDHMRYDYD